MFDYFIMFKSEGKFKRATLEEIRDIYLPLGGKTKTLTDEFYSGFLFKLDDFVFFFLPTDVVIG